jgi:hypothetical protein
MYYPYLRGKQFELIALRELSELMAEEPQKISPIIEPVKETSTLKSTIKELSKKQINFNIIINPSVGNMVDMTDEILEIISAEVGEYSNFQIAILIDSETEKNDLIKLESKIKFSFSGYSLIHIGIKENIEEIINYLDSSIINNIIYFSKTNRRYYRKFNPETRIILDDYFNSQEKNSAYLKVGDSNYSEEHLYYNDEGFKGFSDFLTIGDNYSDSGFLPYAIAIHLSYTLENNIIRIKHFVSDSNDDQTDIGGKFAEANNKLVNWCNENKIKDTKGISDFKALYKTGHFPGLGSIKKLSVMHHIELIKNLI